MNNKMQKYKNLLGAYWGTAIEFYDFTLFGLCSTLIARNFFPESNPFLGLIFVYLIFASGFMMRPLGGLLFGSIGDKYGRKKALLVSVISMAIPTCVIGFLPSYETAGLFSPLILVFCRLIQGLCAGGEFSGAAIFVIEHSEQKKKYFYGSLVTAASVVGMLLASSLSSYFTQNHLPEWFWRVPFIMSLPLSLIGIYIRRHLKETKDFEQSKKEESLPLLTVLKTYKESVFATVGIGSFIGILYYVPFVFMVHYLEKFSSLTTSFALGLITYGLLIYMTCIAVCGFYADKVGGLTIMTYSSLSSIILAGFSFYLIQCDNFLCLLLSITMLSVLAGTFVGPANFLTAQLFPSHVRCRGVSFSLSLGISLFGGLTPALLTFFVTKLNVVYAPAIWLSMGAIVAQITLRYIPRLRLDSNSTNAFTAI